MERELSAFSVCRACGKPLVLATLIGLAAAQFHHACASWNLSDVDFDLAKLLAKSMSGTSATSAGHSTNSFIVEGYDDGAQYVRVYRADEQDRVAEGTRPFTSSTKSG